MTLALEQWKEILDAVIPNKGDILEQIKGKLKEQDEDTYKNWEQKGFYVDHLFDVSPDLPSYKSTLSHMAISNGCLDIAQALLIKNGADVNVENSNGDTPLHQAAFWGHLDIVQYLIKNKANVKVKNNNGDTPLHEAVVRGYLEISECLIENGADVNVTYKHGNTLLYKAAIRGHLKIVKALLKKKADVNVICKYGDTPLHGATVRGYLDIVNALLENGADVNVENSNGDTPLHSAATGGHLKIVQALLKTEADVNVADNYGNTPLHKAIFRGHLDIVEALLENGADVKVKNSNGDTPLHSAATGGHLKIVQALLKTEADVNVTDNYGNTPLHKAIFRGHLDTVKTAFIDRLEIVEALLENGADINITDKHDDTSLFLAHRWKHEVIVNSIVKHIAKLKAIDSYVSKDNLQFINASEERNNNYLQHLRNCKKEVQMIKERNEPLYNFLRENDVNKMLGIWEKNENVRNEFDNEESLKKQYPEYAHILINKAKGARNNNDRKQEIKRSVVDAFTLAIPNIASEMGIEAGAFCLLASSIIHYFNKPSDSLKNIDIAKVVVNQEQNYNSR
ncbi:ankyrin repeat domain-containing protein [Wolbachia endosymbiont (group B) of Chorthippus brunneus]|nr:ankyrin repeat domain-containing protein [Wolbachia endosymbiont (group B) of Chorthippus brunneus]